MNKIILFFLLISRFLNGQTYDTRLHGNVGEKFASKEIFIKKFDYELDVYSMPEKVGKIDDKGEFDVTLSLQPYALIALSFGGEKYSTFAIEEGESVIFSSEDRKFNYSGSKGSEEIRIFKQSLNPLNEKYFGKLMSKVTMAMEKSDTILMKELEKEQDKQLPLFKKELEGNVSKIQTPGAIFYAITYLDENKNKDFLIEICTKLIHEHSNTVLANNLSKKLARINALALGTEPPAIIAMDIDSNEIRCENYRGKYLLIDFWASWCIPCRIENPKLLNIYNATSRKDFEIIAISQDEDLEKMQKAIQKDGTTWTQIQDIGNFLSSGYGVSSLPQNVLLDKEGRILFKNLKSNELEKLLRDLVILH